MKSAEGWSSHRIAASPHVDRLLGLCAQPTLRSELADMIREAARHYDAWPMFIERAEMHGIAPLAQDHLEKAGADVPRLVRRDLLALKMRHGQAAKTRASLIAEIDHALTSRGYPALFLKGAALSHLVYPEARLRSMRDMDILVVPEHVPAVGAALASIGFKAPSEATWATDEPGAHHPVPRERWADGYCFNIEVHRRLNIRRRGARRWLEQLMTRSQPVDIGGAIVRTLGPTDMLYHVHYHGFGAPLGWADRLRLVSAADVFGIVEKWHREIDWGHIKKLAPRTYEALAWFEAIAPWSEEVRSALGMSSPPAPFEGRDYRGYPREAVAERWREPAKYAMDTLRPPTWWLRLRYGGGPGPLGATRAWLRHMKDVWRPSWVGGDRFIGDETNRPRT